MRRRILVVVTKGGGERKTDYKKKNTHTHTQYATRITTTHVCDEGHFRAGARGVAGVYGSVECHVALGRAGARESRRGPVLGCAR